jgi:hypothetical protein
MEQADLVERYRHLRRVAGDIQNGALALVQYSHLTDFGRRVGIPSRRGVLNEDRGNQKLVFDLAIHTARPGRSRAIDRYARTVSFVPGSDEARLLQAVQRARFCFFRFESRHPVAGAVAYEIIEQRQFHFMDVSVGLSGETGDAYVGRLVEIDGCRMSCLTIVPVNQEVLDRAGDRFPADAGGSMADKFQDARYAIAFYRTAVEYGIMQQTVTFDPSKQLPTESDIRTIKSLSDRLSLGLSALTAVG